MRQFALAFALAAASVLSGCGDKSCKNACDKLDSCAIGSSGFSCDSNCGSPNDQCAVCVNDKSCDDILAGQCRDDCTKATFTKK